MSKILKPYDITRMVVRIIFIMNIVFILFLVLPQNLVSSLIDMLVHLYIETKSFMLLISETNK